MLPASLQVGVEDLVRREASCCAFLTIITSTNDDVLSVEITSVEADALPVIEGVAGIAAR